MSVQNERQRVLVALAGRPRNSKALQRQYIRLTARMIAAKPEDKMNKELLRDLHWHCTRAAMWLDRAAWSTDELLARPLMKNAQEHLDQIIELTRQTDQSLAPAGTTPDLPSDKPCAEVNPVLWSHFCRVTGRNGDPSAVWSEADVVQCLDAKRSARLSVV